MTAASGTSVVLTVNGAEVAVGGQHPHLLAALREELGLTAAKDGCSPQGQCGCCTVLLEGKPIQACLVTMERVAGKEVTTLEGFGPAERERLSSAFAAAGALQCGFCTPGQVLSLKALLDRVPHPSEEQIKQALAGNICRCGAYPKILKAAAALAEPSREV